MDIFKIEISLLYWTTTTTTMTTTTTTMTMYYQASDYKYFCLYLQSTFKRSDPFGNAGGDSPNQGLKAGKKGKIVKKAKKKKDPNEPQK